MLWSTPIFFPIAEIFHLFFLSRKSPTFISSSGAPKKRRGAKSFLPFSDFFCDIIRLDGEACLYIWLFIQLFFLGKYNQGFNSFPKSKTNSFGLSCEALRYSLSNILPQRRSPFWFHFLGLWKSDATQNFPSPPQIFLWYYKIRCRTLPICMTFYSTLFFRKIESSI